MVNKGSLSDSCMQILQQIRDSVGVPLTVGLSDEVIIDFIKEPCSPVGSDLARAINDAGKAFELLSEDERKLLLLAEDQLRRQLQSGVLNFYPADCMATFVPLVAQGPWIITCYGRVVYETGGYGMLGFGYNPEFLHSVFQCKEVMSNVMTANFVQSHCVDLLKGHIGSTRKEGCPYAKFVFMNSGSEAMTVAARISDAYAGKVTDKDYTGPYRGKSTRFLALVGSFHGRTERPALASESLRKRYAELASFRGSDKLWTVEPNDVEGLKLIFKRANDEGIYIEAFFMEPVMGEGNPGLMITPEFYKWARQLTREHDSFLIIDSIQAGLRAQGVLSIVDYPGFQDLDPPCIESFSKALNAGQYPLSVLALSKRAVEGYLRGSYGNTMTANPRALRVGSAVLEKVGSGLQDQVREAGDLFLQYLKELQNELPAVITKVQGTGLLLSVEFCSAIKVFGENSLEEDIRKHGVNVIHGGVNSLRFTPVLTITASEIRLVVDVLRVALKRMMALQVTR